MDIHRGIRALDQGARTVLRTKVGPWLEFIQIAHGRVQNLQLANEHAARIDTGLIWVARLR